MTKTYSLFTSFMKMMIRDKQTVFWMLLFPLILLPILMTIIGGLDKPQNFKFKVIVLTNESGLGVDLIRRGLSSVSTEGESEVLDVGYKKLGQDKKVVNTELEKVKETETKVLVVIPDGFEGSLRELLVSGQLREPKPAIMLYYLKERSDSQIAANVVISIVRGVNKGLAVSAGIPVENYELNEISLGSGKRIRYKDYIFPGLLIFALLSIAITGMTGTLVEFKSGKILKRLSLAPIKSSQLMVSFSLTRIILMVVSIALLSVTARTIFDVNVNPLDPVMLMYMGLSGVTFASIAFMIAGLVSNTQQATVIAQILLQAMQFLGGLYFDVLKIPLVLRWFVYINPVTYLVYGIRSKLDLAQIPYPYYLSYAVPLAWIAVCVVLSIRYFRWMERS